MSEQIDGDLNSFSELGMKSRVLLGTFYASAALTVGSMLTVGTASGLGLTKVSEGALVNNLAEYGLVTAAGASTLCVAALAGILHATKPDRYDASQAPEASHNGHGFIA